jgi:hypothetical protein
MNEGAIKTYIRHYFNDQERLDISNKMSEAFIEKSTLEADLKTVQSQFKSRIQEAMGQIGTLAQKLNSGWEMREIQCRVIKDYNEGVVRFESIETDEIVDERPMTLDERQMKIGDEVGDGEEEQESGGKTEGQETQAALEEEDI